jgi:hypothetical protein
VFRFEGAAIARQPEQLVHVDGDGLAVVDARLGADDERADLLRVDVRRR